MCACNIVYKFVGYFSGQFRLNVILSTSFKNVLVSKWSRYVTQIRPNFYAILIFTWNLLKHFLIVTDTDGTVKYHWRYNIFDTVENWNMTDSGLVQNKNNDGYRQFQCFVFMWNPVCGLNVNYWYVNIRKLVRELKWAGACLFAVKWSRWWTGHGLAKPTYIHMKYRDK